MNYSAALFTVGAARLGREMALGLVRGGIDVAVQYASSKDTAELAPDGRKLNQATIVNIVDHRLRNITPEFLTLPSAKLGLWTLIQITAQALNSCFRVNATEPGPSVYRCCYGAIDLQGWWSNVGLENARCSGC